MSALALLGGVEGERQAISHLAALRRGGRTRFEAGAGESDLVAGRRLKELCADLATPS